MADVTQILGCIEFFECDELKMSESLKGYDYNVTSPRFNNIYSIIKKSHKGLMLVSFSENNKMNTSSWKLWLDEFSSFIQTLPMYTANLYMESIFEDVLINIYYSKENCDSVKRKIVCLKGSKPII